MSLFSEEVKVTFILILDISMCCTVDVLSVDPAPGLKPPWRDRSFGAAAEKPQPALSHPSYSGWHHTLPCNRQELSLKEEQHLSGITTHQNMRNISSL